MSQILKESHAQEANVLLHMSDLNVEFMKRRSALSRGHVIVNAVNHVSLDIFRGEILAIVGESGSGKTTLAKCVTRLMRPTSGSIKYNQSEITGLKGNELLNYRRDVQLVYQDPYESLNPRQNVLTALSLPLRYLKGEKDSSKTKARVKELIEEVGLDPRVVMYRLPHQLSGGEKQRVNIARALAPNPKLLVADEPITMLDAQQRLNILSLLMDLKSKRDLSILVITHDLASAKIISDRMLVMYLGRIVESGPTQSVLSAPYHPYVDLIRESMPRLRLSNEAAEEQQIASIEESTDISQGCVFRNRCSFATEICSEQEPKLEQKSSQRNAACHHPLGQS